MAGSKAIQRSIRRNSEKGVAALALLLVVGGVAFSWWIFMSIMDYVSARHSEKVKERYDRFASYKKKPVTRAVEREVKGYQVHY